MSWGLFRILAIFCVSFFAETAERNQEALVVVEHWPPWEIALDKDKQIVTDGLAVDIADELFNRLNIELKLVNAPWKRALYMIKTGQVDLIPMIIKDSEREAYMLFTVPIYQDKMVFIYSTERFKTFDWEKWEDLKPFRIGLTRGYSYGEFGEAINKHNIATEFAATDKQNLLKLLAGRVDIVPVLYVNAVSTLEELSDHKKLKFAPNPIDTENFYFAISKKSYLASRLEEINTALNKMKDDGTFKKILGKLYAE